MTTKYYASTTAVPMATSLPRVGATFTATTEKTTVVDADEILMEDSEASGAKKRFLISNFLTGGKVFCTQQGYASKDGLETTTSGSWQTYSMSTPFTLTGPGKFLVLYRATVWGPSPTNDGMGVKVINYTTSTDLIICNAEANSNALWVENVSPGQVTHGLFIVTIGNGVTHEFRLQYRSIVGNTMGLDGGRLFGFRLE